MRHFILILWEILATYLLIGLIFAGILHLKGLARLDPSTIGVNPFFRVLITPGIMALWPVLAFRWKQILRHRSDTGRGVAPRRQETLRAAHALAWRAMAVLVPLVIGAAIWFRPRDRATADDDNDKAVEVILEHSSKTDKQENQ